MAAPLTPDAIEALKAKHGDELRRLAYGADEVLIRPPTRAEFSRFRDKSLDPKRRADAVEEIARASIVYPVGAELEAIVDRRAALLMKAGSVALELAGFDEAVEAEKI